MYFPDSLNSAAAVTIAASTLQWGRFFALSVYALVVYDWLLSLEDEYDLIVNARWTFIKTAYLICRYYPLFFFPIYLWTWLGDHPPSLCASIVHPLYAFFAIFQLSSQAVMMIRAYAFTGQNKLILCLLLLCFSALAASEIWLFGFDFVLVEETFLIFGQSGCFANEGDAQARNTPAIKAAIIMIISFVVDLVMLLLIVGYCLRIRSTQGSLGKIFLLQGVGAFLLISAFTLLSAIVYFGPHRQYDGLALPFMLVSDVLACRLILALRRVVAPTTSEMSRIRSQLVRNELAQAELNDHESQMSQASDQHDCHFFSA